MYSLKQKKDNRRDKFAPRITCRGVTGRLSQGGKALLNGSTSQNSEKGSDNDSQYLDVVDVHCPY